MTKEFDSCHRTSFTLTPAIFPFSIPQSRLVLSHQREASVACSIVFLCTSRIKSSLRRQGSTSPHHQNPRPHPTDTTPGFPLPTFARRTTSCACIDCRTPSWILSFHPLPRTLLLSSRLLLLITIRTTAPHLDLGPGGLDLNLS
ncbi:unnamed protein product [Zymoseptoria tritici ST99CH_3D1]|nr:unnamed protein product [Zymoseptoria tritici ST99CH_3D1]